MSRDESPGTVRPTATTPTVGDLTALRGGRDRLLAVGEVAAELGVCTATVYRLCERGDLPHVRIINSIRVRPRDLAAFVAATKARNQSEDRPAPAPCSGGGEQRRPLIASEEV